MTWTPFDQRELEYLEFKRTNLEGDYSETVDDTRFWECFYRANWTQSILFLVIVSGGQKRNIHLIELKDILFPGLIRRNAAITIQNVVDESEAFGFG